MLHRSGVKHVLILAAVLVALALPLMFLLEDFMRDAIVMPLAYWAWLIGVVLGALPEGCFLMPVVGLAAYLAVRSLQRRPDAAPSARIPHRTTVGATRMWLERIQHVAEGTYSRERLEHYVGQFLMSVVAYENRLSPREALRLIESGEVAIPQDIRRYVDAAFQGGVATKQSGLARIRTVISRLLHGRKVAGMSLAEIEERVDPALAYIEEELRMAHPEAQRE